LPSNPKSALLLAASLIATYLVASQLASAADGTNRALARVRAPSGRPCLTYSIEAREEVVMKATFDHLVRVGNSCLRRIVVTVCYAGSRDNCRRLNLPAYGEDTAFLGSMYKQPLFAFDYEERGED
jgi:hypothetical protein